MEAPPIPIVRPGSPGQPWHVLPVEDVATVLETSSLSGLSAEEAAGRLERWGLNAIEQRPLRHPLRILLSQFSDFMVLLLAAAAALAGVIGEPQDSLAIAAILLINAVLGFSQEYRADRALHALKILSIAGVRVHRGGASLTVPATYLVPGDLVILEAGNLVPADLRVTEAAQLRIEEAALTGESQPEEKRPAALRETHATPGDRSKHRAASGDSE